MDALPSFEQWVAMRETALLRTAWLLTGEAALAEDLVQTALLRCWPRWARIVRLENPEAYVRQVMARTYVSWWRRRWRGEIPTEHLPEQAQEPAEDARQDRAAVVAALARLPRGQRAVLVLRFAEDMSEAQTALALSCSVGTVKSQSSRGLRALRADAALLQEVGPA